jgi:DNA-binding SARP family transcriptional activator/Tfp pilus assembly protein PilF
MSPRRDKLDIRLLGPVRAYAGSQPLDLGPRKQRLVLAVLALDVDRVVPVQRMVELAWPVDAPRTAAHAVRVSVSGLRSILAGRSDARIETSGAGYALRVDPDQIDASRFRRLLKRAAEAADDPSRVALLDEALSLWSGPAVYGTALSGTAPVETQDSLCRGLEESRLTAIEDRLDAELRLGRHRSILGEVTGLARAHPTRERLAAQLMLCLYRDGRQTEALDAYRALRERLGEEFGVDPGAAVRELHLAVLRDDPALRPVDDAPVGERVAGGRAAGDPAPAQLPPPVGVFVGRTAELDRLDALLADDAATIVVVSGMAGVGKTALVVHWGHRERATFPDGQLYVNLNGYGAGLAVTPERVLARFLAALGVPAERIPADPEEATALYRTIVADRRILVILDNATGAEQVRPLMPGGRHCRVVITSRSRLGGLVARDGARPLDLGVLTADLAVDLLARLIGDAEPSPLLPELARLCAYLPLALRIAAAHLVGHPDGPPGYVARLRDASRLAALEIDDDREAAVRGAFDLSYAALDGPARRMFRLLGLVPGADVSLAAAAALAGVAPGDAEPALEALADAHLVERAGPGRYALHDLLRLYAGERAESDEADTARTHAIDRLEAFYLRATDTAARLLYPTSMRLPFDPTPPGSPAAPVTDHGSASAWLDAERANLIAIVNSAAGAGRHATAYALGDMLGGYFWMRRNPADWLEVAGVALAAARAASEPRAQAACHRGLSGAYVCLGRLHLAIAELDQGLALAERAGWREGQAAMHSSRATAVQDLGDTVRAEFDYLVALTLYRAAGHRAGEPVVLSNLGGLYMRLGRFGKAADAFRRALAVDQQLGGAGDVAIDLGNLGGACWRLGNLDEAIRHLTAGLDIHRQLGNRAGEANTLNYLARVHHDAGRGEQAAAFAEADLAKAQEINDPLIEADAWNAVGTAHLALGRHRESTHAHRRALDLARGTGYRYGTAEALIGLAASTAAVDAHTDSLDHARRALEIAEQGRFLILEGYARAAIATGLLATGDGDAALVEASRAEAIHHETGHPLGRARAQRLLGDIVAHNAAAQALNKL